MKYNLGKDALWLGSIKIYILNISNHTVEQTL